MQVALIANGITLVVAIGGWTFAYLMQREKKLIASQKRKMEKFQVEVRARIALEKAACEWLSELTHRTNDAVKRELRNRAQERSGIRPKMSDSDFTT